MFPRKEGKDGVVNRLTTVQDTLLQMQSELVSIRELLDEHLPEYRKED